MQCLASEKGRYVPFKEGATEFAPARERVRYWESYTTSELIATVSQASVSVRELSPLAMGIPSFSAVTTSEINLSRG